MGRGGYSRPRTSRPRRDPNASETLRPHEELNGRRLPDEGLAVQLEFDGLRVAAPTLPLFGGSWRWHE